MYFTDISYVVRPVGRIVDGFLQLLGTAFFINKVGLLATAAHVVEYNDDNLIIVENKINSIQDYQDTSIEKFSVIPARIKAINPVNDVCILEVEDEVQSLCNIESSDMVNVGQDISLFGYPHCNHDRMVLTQQNTSIGAKILIKNNGIKTKNLILNIQSQPGQSGSPIIIAKEHLIVGILIGSYVPKQKCGVSIAGIDPLSIHQTTHAVSAEYIKEMI